LTERDIVLQNTLRNAGRRRSSSSHHPSRRQSGHELDDNPEASPRLKWDEANLYLTEQERTPKMKIDEPKTPFAKGYDPAEDEAELRMLDAEDIQVDELDAKPPRRRITPDTHIPDLDLGEPEEPPRLLRKESHSPKQVVVKEDEDAHHTHEAGAEPETPEEEEKHKKFEELRKKHYEMKNVANLLG
jgi:protein phosphatase inhibitor 2